MVVHPKTLMHILPNTPGNSRRTTTLGGTMTTLDHAAAELGRERWSDRERRSERGEAVRSLIPARIDRLGWSRFHTRLVVALGVAWVLDGLEITIAGNVTASSATSPLSTCRRLGGLLGGDHLSARRGCRRLFFGRLSDKWGRRNLFMITLGVYLVGGVLTALTFGHSQVWVYWLWISRFIAGMGIGGEYAAINSAIDELIPAKYRGRVDIAVNGTYWGGALLATVLTCSSSIICR